MFGFGLPVFGFGLPMVALFFEPVSGLLQFGDPRALLLHAFLACLCGVLPIDSLFFEPVSGLLQFGDPRALLLNHFFPFLRYLLPFLRLPLPPIFSLLKGCSPVAYTTERRERFCKKFVLFSRPQRFFAVLQGALTRKL